jgi:hypothetical protein
LLHPERPHEPRRPSVSSIRSLVRLAAAGVALLVLLTHPARPGVFEALALVALAGTLLFVSCLLRAMWCLWASVGREAAPS